MNHDIAHCNNFMCKRKEKCYRYVAYLDLASLRDDERKYYSFIKVDNPDECDCFWDNEKYNKL